MICACTATPTGRRAARAVRRAAAFTLIEMLAVTAIIALLAAVALPNFGILETRAARAEANRLAAVFEFARQRSVATGVAHRVVLDLEDASYRLEWLVTEARAQGGGDVEPPELYAPDRDEPIHLAPPRAERPEWRAVAGQHGLRTFLPDEIASLEVERDGLVTRHGEVELAFARDGTVDATQVRLESSSGVPYTLDVAPWRDGVRVRSGDATR